MEGLILMELGFNLQIPTLPQFADRIIQECNITSPEILTFIRSMIDYCLLDFQSFNTFAKFELCSAILYFTAKYYKEESLKTQVSFYKNKIDP